MALRTKIEYSGFQLRSNLQRAVLRIYAMVGFACTCVMRICLRVAVFLNCSCKPCQPNPVERSRILPI